jgi:thioredoxin reductase
VIIACGLLHYPRQLPVLDAPGSKKVFYKMPKIGDYAGQHVVVVGAGDSALDAAVMALGRHSQVDVLMRGATAAGKAETLSRIVRSGASSTHRPKSPPPNSPVIRWRSRSRTARRSAPTL